VKEIIRVLRVIEYEGDREWIERTLAKSIEGEYVISPTRIIRATVVGASVDGKPYVPANGCAMPGHFADADTPDVVTANP
jgi:hypothetical protein